MGEIVIEKPILKTCVGHDPESHCLDETIWSDEDCGAYTRRTYGARARTDADRWADIRATRDGLLRASDATSLVRYADLWLAQTDDWRAKWTAYRKALRDLPETYDEAGPLAVVWPDPPAN